MLSGSVMVMSLISITPHCYSSGSIGFSSFSLGELPESGRKEYTSTPGFETEANDMTAAAIKYRPEAGLVRPAGPTPRADYRGRERRVNSPW